IFAATSGLQGIKPNVTYFVFIYRDSHQRPVPPLRGSPSFLHFPRVPLRSTPSAHTSGQALG
ncbi:MAG TPA: hypothetical protein VG759_27045, partial [Candidatus Angelobacter sp.]|nr:hypothetical protein [Candidatus Angelobacter sp.]